MPVSYYNVGAALIEVTWTALEEIWREYHQRTWWLSCALCADITDE
jgi:hypothetical protein